MLKSTRTLAEDKVKLGGGPRGVIEERNGRQYNNIMGWVGWMGKWEWKRKHGRREKKRHGAHEDSKQHL